MLNTEIGSDWALVDRCRTGHDEAFTELMRCHKQPVLNFIYRMLGNAADAEDVAQDVFVRTYQAIVKPSFQPGKGKFTTWLFQIAHNAAIDTLRRRQRHPVDSMETVGQQPVASATATPYKELANLELGNQIAAAVAALPSDQKTALILSEYHDLSCAEIAGIMTCTEKSVESRLYRAKQQLRKTLRITP